MRPISSFSRLNRIPAEGWKSRWYRLTGKAPVGFVAKPKEPEKGGPDRLGAVARYCGASEKKI